MGLSQVRVGARDVEDVVDDLEQDAELGGERGEPAWRAAAQQQDALDGDADQPARLELVQPPQVVHAPGDVDVLAADHPVDPGGRGELGDRGKQVRGLGALGGEHVAERLGVEAVAGEDRHVLAVDLVVRRAPAAQVVVVHRRQVVVDERVGVDQLERRRERQHVARVAADRTRGRQGEHRPDALAAREQAVAHRLLEPRCRRLVCEGEALEIILDERTKVVGIDTGRQGVRQDSPELVESAGNADDDRVNRHRALRPLTIVAIALAVVAIGALAWFLADTQSDQRRDLRARYADRTAVAASLIDSLFRLAFTSQSQQASQQWAAPHISRARLDAAVKRQQLGWSMVVDDHGKVIGASSGAPSAPDQGTIRGAAAHGFGVGAVRPGNRPVVDSAVKFSTPTGVRYLVNGTPLKSYRTFLDGTLKPLPTLKRSRAFVIDQNGRALGAAISAGRRAAMPSPQMLRAIKDRDSASYRAGGTGIYGAATTIPNTSWRVISTAADGDLYASASGPGRWVPWAILLVGALTLAAVAVLLRRLLLTNAALQDSQRRVEQRARELERSNADLEQFAYAASHDLSEPLRTVAGFSELLRQRYAGRLDSDADEYITYMNAGVKRMQQLIDDLLLYSRIGRAPLREETVELEGVLADVLGWLAPAIDERGAQITHDPLPAVRGERGQIAQVLQNLVANAIKFTAPATAPRVHVSARRTGASLQVSVTDNGIGVDGASDVIFKMFGRLHPVDTYPGTGIGLALAKRIVEAHGGRIWVDSAPDGGSVFSFTVPAAVQARHPVGMPA